VTLMIALAMVLLGHIESNGEYVLFVTFERKGD
jgi:hypothetical protein